MATDTRAANLRALHMRLSLTAENPPADPLPRWALVLVAPDERRGAPEMSVRVPAGSLEEVLALAREGLGDVLYPQMPVEIIDLDSGMSLRPQWERLSWAPAIAR